MRINIKLVNKIQMNQTKAHTHELLRQNGVRMLQMTTTQNKKMAFCGTYVSRVQCTFRVIFHLHTAQ